MTEPATRPPIGAINSAEELRRWYWLKSELVAQARRLGIVASGAKFTVLERLCHFYDTGERSWPGDVKKAVSSTFDWRGAQLSADTVITDNYQNTQNVRRYFVEHVDAGFKFNIELMEWFAANKGKTLHDAAEFWRAQQRSAAKTTIKSHNQFNQYARDFIADNPDKNMRDVRHYWSLKKRLPSDDGRHRYDPGDLELDS